MLYNKLKYIIMGIASKFSSDREVYYKLIFFKNQLKNENKMKKPKTSLLR